MRRQKRLPGFLARAGAGFQIFGEIHSTPGLAFLMPRDDPVWKRNGNAIRGDGARTTPAAGGAETA